MSYNKMTKEELEKQVVNETELIAKLEKSYPPFVKVNGDRYDQYRPENKEYFQHGVEIQDAYWRRRMCRTSLDSLNKTEAERDKLIQQTASIY